jgi:hypothetical protein
MAVFNAILRFISNGGSVEDLESATPETVSIQRIYVDLCAL